MARHASILVRIAMIRFTHCHAMPLRYTHLFDVDDAEFIDRQDGVLLSE